MKEGPTKRDGPADAPSTGAVDAPDGGQRGAGANWQLATADAYAQLPGPPSSHQPVHAVSNGENRKTGARNRSGGSLHLAGRVGTLPFAVASRCRWHGHRQRQRKCCCGKNAPGYLHGCFPLRPPRRRYLNIFKNYISVTNYYNSRSRLQTEGIVRKPATWWRGLVDSKLAHFLLQLRQLLGQPRHLGGQRLRRICRSREQGCSRQ